MVDNGATVIFAAVMSVWATLFLEGWKRHLARVAWKWDLLDREVEEVRSESVLVANGMRNDLYSCRKRLDPSFNTCR